MTITELTKRYHEILSSDTVDLSKANDLLKEITADYTTHENTTSTLNNIKDEISNKDNEINNLKQANYQLFLSAGSTTPLPEDKPNQHNQPAPFDNFETLEAPGDKEIADLINQLITLT